MKILYQNCRGLRTKAIDFRHNVLSQNTPIIALTETWLNTSISTNAYFDDRYSVIRNDRKQEIRGGGVAVALLSDILFAQVDASITCIDNIWIKITTCNKPIILGCVYFPPALSVEDIRTTFCQLEDFILHSNESVLIVGDFNINTKSNDYYSTLKHSILNDLLLVCNSTQQNIITNNVGSLLDLVITDLTLSIARADEPLVVEDIFHPALTIELSKTSLQRKSFSNFPKWNFRKGDYNQLYEDAKSCNWTKVLECNDPDTASNVFEEMLHELVARSIPITAGQNKNKRKFPTRFSTELIKLLQQKRTAHNLYKKNKVQTQYQIYSDLRKRCKLLQKENFHSHVLQIEQHLLAQPKTFWQYQKSINTNSQPLLSNLTTFNGCQIEETTDVCNMLAQHFHSITSCLLMLT